MMGEPFVSKTCEGERCWCGQPAVRKVGEEFAFDEPDPGRHNLTSYICAEHYAQLMGPLGAEHVGLQSIPEPLTDYTLSGEEDRALRRAHLASVKIVKRLEREPLLDEGLVSVRIDPATAQTLMDWNVLHTTDAGWVIDLDIWRSALSIPRLEAGRVTEAMLEAGFKALGVPLKYANAETLRRAYLAMSSASAPVGEDQ